MQPGICDECGGELTRIESPLPNQDPVEAFICLKCSRYPTVSSGCLGVRSGCKVLSEYWMFKEFPKDHPTWECCVKEFKKTKRRADLWDDLKHVLENGTWSDPETIEAVLTNMAYMESESTQ